MNTIRIKVGEITYSKEFTERLTFECAAWHRDVLVQPGTYPVFAYIEWTCDGGGMFRLRNLRAECEGVITSASFQALWGGSPIHGTKDRGLDEIGRKHTVYPYIATYGKAPRSAEGLVLDACVEIELFDGKEVGPMWHYLWRKGTKFTTQPKEFSYELLQNATLDAVS